MKTILLYVAAAVLILFPYLGFYETYKDVKDITKESAQWEYKYNLAVATNEKNVETIKRMEENHAGLLKDLSDWQDRQYATERQLSNAKNKLHKLERDSDKYRDLLSTPIPCELWLQIFPNSPRCPRTN